MSSALENRAQIRAMLLEEGRAVSVKRNVPGAYNPATGATAAGTPTTYTGLGRLGTYADRMIDGTNIKRGDRLLTWQPDDWSFEPQPNDAVTIPDGYNLVGPMQKRELGGVPFCFTAQVRK